MSDLKSIKFKNSKTLRRTIKPKLENVFFTSLLRIRNIQSLLSHASNDNPGATTMTTTTASSSSSSLQPDAIICILGIDSRYDEAMIELANYLFFDIFKNTKSTLEEHGLTEEILEDVMIVIRADRVDFFCNPIAIRHFLPYIGSWKNLRIHCMKDNEYNDDNEDEVEEFKIRSFVTMVDGCSVIGFPFGCHGHSAKKFDQMAIEKWPIIQAFALDGFGGGGFFTMKFQVIDVSCDLHCAYHTLDPVALEILVTEKLGFLKTHWLSMMSVCDYIQKSGTDLTEAAICDPLKSYFEHGHILTDSKKIDAGVPPFVLLGLNTGRKFLKQTSTGSGIIETRPTETTLPTHMICESVSPDGQLRCRRTYFFQNDVSIFQSENLGKNFGLSKENPKFQETEDMRALAFIYKATILAAAAFIKSVGETNDLNRSKVVAKHELETECQKLGIAENVLSWLRNNSEIEMCINNRDGRNSSGVVRSVVVTVYDIPSLGRPGQSLGSVSYAESFVSSTIQVQHRDDRVESNGATVAITSCIPPFMAWTMDGESKEIDRQVRLQLTENRLKGVGAQLCAGTGASFVRYDGCTDDVLRNGELYIYENAIAFIHSVCGCVLVPLSELQSVCFHDGGAMGVVAVLAITFTDRFRSFLPSCLCSSFCNRLICLLAPKSRAYRAVFSNVLPSWKNLDDMKKLLKIWNDLPSDIVDLHNQFQKEFTLYGTGSTTLNGTGNTIIPQSNDFQAIKSCLPNLSNVIQHLLLSCAGNQCLVFADHLPVVLGQSEYDPGQFHDSSRMVLTVIAGSPGSRKEIIFRGVEKELLRRGENWTVIRASPQSKSEEFDASEFHRSVEIARDDSSAKGLDRQIRGILLYPGFFDLTDLLRAVQTHRWITIGAVTVCVDPVDFFMERFYSLPKLLDTCGCGLANNVAITNFSCSDEDLGQVQSLIRSANPDVAFISADEGIIARDEDLEAILSEDSFESPSFLRARYISHPGWWQGVYSQSPQIPPVNQILLRFSQPLEKSKFLSRLKSLKSNLKEFPFQGNIYYVRGCTYFTGSVQLHEVTFATLSGHLRLVPKTRARQETSVSDSTSYFLIFGCKLDENRLKNWLRESTERNLEKPLRTRDSMTSAEIQRIHKERRTDVLPDGWFYNGNQFISMDGEKSNIHPNLEEFLKDHLDRINLQIREYNASLEKEKMKDLFD